MQIIKMIFCKDVGKDAIGQYLPSDSIFKIEEVFYPNKIEKCSLLIEAKSDRQTKISLSINSPKKNILQKVIHVIPDVEGRWVKIITLDALPLEDIGEYSIKVKSFEKVLKEISFKADYPQDKEFTVEEELEILNDPNLISEVGRTILSGSTKKKYNIYLSLDDTKEPPEGYIRMPSDSKFVEENGNIIDLEGLKRDMKSKFGQTKNI